MIKHSEPTGSSKETPMLTSLRALIPDHDLRFRELFGVINAQANALRTLNDVHTSYLPISVIAHQPAIRVESTDVPIAGFTFWDSGARQWVIGLNHFEPLASRRFTLVHEFAHIVWYAHESKLFAGLSPSSQKRLAEHAADIFAGEVLMPSHLVIAAHAAGLRTIAQLAAHFRVSSGALQWRLDHLGLSATGPRSADAEPTSYLRPVPLVEVAS